MATIRDICADALMEIGALAQGEAISDGDATFVLGKLNRLLDNWNAERQAVYAEQYATYTLVPGTSPHTIGPAASSPTWTAAQRPVSIDSVLLNLGGDVYTPIRLRDAQWYDAQLTPAITSDIPTDCYYNPAWPLGQLYFWPVPSTAYDVELQTRVVLANVTLPQTFTLPPGYQDAVTLTLAESLVPAFGRPGNADLSAAAAKARARIFANNVQTPRLRTQDAGMPVSGGPRPYFNWLTGEPL